MYDKMGYKMEVIKLGSQSYIVRILNHIVFWDIYYASHLLKFFNEFNKITYVMKTCV